MTQPKKIKSARKNSPKPAAKAAPRKKSPTRAARATAPAGESPVTLEQARALVRARAPKRALRGPAATAPAASPESIGLARERLAAERRREDERRIREYQATMEIMKRRGVKGLDAKAVKAGKRRAPGAGRPAAAPKAPAAQPLQIFAEGDSWFDYPPFLFSGGLIPRLEKRLGVPILNLAKAGDEVRYMLGVEQRRILTQKLSDGSPAGGPWDALLFSGGGNDIVDNPMALWVRDFVPAKPAKALIHQARYDSALALVRAGYEDLITLRDSYSPGTRLIFHAYDFAIPDGRGVCHLGPWMKPTFDLRKFPAASSLRFEVVKEMLKQFAALMLSLESHSRVTFINGQGTLTPGPGSWHNELHPTKDGFDLFADLFHKKLQALFPTRVL